MNIRLNKNELAGALSALGKLVSRPSPIEAFRSVEIKEHNNAVTFRTAALNETICYRVPAETMEEFTSLVDIILILCYLLQMEQYSSSCSVLDDKLIALPRKTANHHLSFCFQGRLIEHWRKYRVFPPIQVPCCTFAG